MDFSSIALTDTPPNTSDAFGHSPTSTFGGPSAAMSIPMGSGSSGQDSNEGNGEASNMPVVTATGDDSLEDPLDEGNMFGQGRSAAVGPRGMAKLRRDSIAHSQGMGGVSWGSLTIGSWLRDEVMFHATLKNSRSNSVSKTTTVHLYPPSANSASQVTTRRPSHSVSFTAGSPPAAYNAYLPNLEKQYCKDYSCCGLSLPGLHDLLRHYEEAHIATSPNSNTQVPGPTGPSSKKKFYRQQASSDITGIPRQQQLQQQPQPQPQHPQHPQFRKATLQQQNPSQQQQHQQQQQHIIQQQLSPHSTMVGTAASARSSGSPPPLGSTGATASEASQGPQLHLNGSLVDAVSTNDVFLQAGNNSHSHAPASAAARHMAPRQQRQNMQQPHTNQHASFNSQQQHQPHSNVVQQNITNHPSGKIPLTPQHSFNAYSLQGGKQPGNSGSNVSSNTNNNSNNNTIIQQPNGLPNVSSKIGTNKFNMSTGLELDFMDEDMVGSDVEEADSAAFMRLTSASPHGGMPLAPQSSSSASSRFASMALPTSVHHPTPPASTAALAGPLMNATSGVDEEDEDEDEDEDEEDEDVDEDDEDMTGEGSDSHSKTLQNSFHRQEGFIDDPARRLYVMDHEEHKPFKCPVIGCDKTYKNQNGLKYHKLHGHQNQKLHENPDGSFSIIDPESNEPYPDGMGYEKDKPYRCEVCGKRYKNLNGLKYHRGHSTH